MAWVILMSFPVEVLAQGREVLVLSAQDSMPVADAVMTLYNSRRDSIASCVSDIDGVAMAPDTTSYALVRHGNFAERLAQLSATGPDTIWLRPATMIRELVVTASNGQDHVTHTTYVIPREDMKRYPTFYLCLNEIPNMIVDRGIGLFYEGSSNVALMLNGVVTDKTELQAISKDDVLKVNVYKVAPVRFLAQGYESAVDVITKATLTGGNLAMNLMQSFHPLYGDNDVSLFYNNRRSRFKALYVNSNRHLTKSRQDDLLRYEFDGVEYFKHKKGLDSHNNVNDNTLTLGYQNNLPDSYLYSITLTGGISRNGKDLRQEITSGYVPHPYEDLNALYVGSNTINVNNYFEKSLGEGGAGGKLMADVTYRFARSHFDSNYREFADGSGMAPTVDQQSLYDIHYQTVMAEVSYQTAYRRWGQLSFSAYNTWQRSRYSEPGYGTTRQTTDDCGLTGMYIGRTGNLTYVATMGLGMRSISPSGDNAGQRLWRPLPSVSLYYYILRNLWVSLAYRYNTTSPTIGQLSQTDQWIDTRLVYHGNPSLRTYSRHTVGVATSLSSRYIDTSFQLNYTDAPGMICNYFMDTPAYLLETIVNLKEYRNILGNLTLTGKPLGSNIWTISTSVNLGRLWGAGETYRWRGVRFQWMSFTNVNLDKWNIYARYQYPGRVVEGQLIMPRTQIWAVGVAFRPQENLSIGIEVCDPFGKGLKESQRTVNTSLVERENIRYVPERANMVSITFDWNLQFGHNHNRAQQAMNHSTEETGILYK